MQKAGFKCRFCHRNGLIGTENKLMLPDGKGARGLGEKDEGSKKYKLVITKVTGI